MHGYHDVVLTAVATWSVQSFVNYIGVLELLRLLELVVAATDLVEVEKEGEVEAATVVRRRVHGSVDVKHVRNLIVQRLVIVDAKVVQMYCQQISTCRVVSQLIQ